MRITVLGSGSSSGVPAIDQGWGKCDPAEPRNRRRRPGLLVEDDACKTRVLIDTPPDLRAQLIDTATDWLSAVVYTHPHADHLHGIDDLRGVNRAMQKPIPVYADRKTFDEIEGRFGYVLQPIPEPDDGSPVFYFKPVLYPQHEIAPGDRFEIGGLDFTVFDQDHGYSHTLGFRIGDFAYSTDVTRLDEDAFDVLGGVRFWMIGVLGEHEHPTHVHVAKAVDWVKRVEPDRAVFGHLGPGLDYATLKRNLPPNIEPAYDGMVFEV